jgi:hypothetical protein
MNFATQGDLLPENDDSFLCSPVILKPIIIHLRCISRNELLTAHCMKKLLSPGFRLPAVALAQFSLMLFSIVHHKSRQIKDSVAS